MLRKKFTHITSLALSAFFLCQCAEEHVCQYDASTETLRCAEKLYKTAHVEDQVWMTDNLDYYVFSSFCYSDNDANCDKYGRLYTWESAQNACPAHWHLPSQKEFKSLLKKGIQNVQLAGFRYYGYGSQYFDKGATETFWTADEYDDARAELLNIRQNSWRFEKYNKEIAYSVRCVMD